MKNKIFTIIIAVILGLGMYVVYVFFSSVVETLENIDNSLKEQKAQIGQIYVMDGDTLTVIDFSAWNNTYTLSNGIKIHQSLINSKLNN